MNPIIRESCVRAGNTGFIFTLTFILFVLCGTVNLLIASDAQSASSDSVAELVNTVNDLTIRISNLEARLQQYERYERYERIDATEKADTLGSHSSRMHLAKENAWRQYRWTDSAQWKPIKLGLSKSAVIELLGEPPRWVQSMKPSVDEVFYYQIGGRFKGSHLKGKVSFKEGVVVDFQIPDFSKFHSYPKGFFKRSPEGSE